MIQANSQIDLFKQQLRDSLRRETLNARAITLAKRAHVYTGGDPAETVYFIESGQVKLLIHSPEGKECLLAILTAGDVFGELCFSGSGARLETAVARGKTVLKQIPAAKFLARLSRDGLNEGFVQYLTVRIAEQQRVIANLVMVDSEQRLGKTLLYLAHKLGKKNACDICLNGSAICIEQKISHEELSEMVGTTRPRISLFMQRFRHLGLVETSAKRFLIIKENKLTDYLAQVGELRDHSFQNCPVLDSNTFRASVALNSNRSRTGAVSGLARKG
jgi:CRP/FNR family transcriptional regulator, cyclic AMP receptor protein